MKKEDAGSVAEGVRPVLAQEASQLNLEPCEKAHDAEQDRWDDEDGACDDGLRG
ncbi:MAG: hypothetical protein HKM06_00340 [Spirochaetales bacterium]|nr:hypothetical protein [Spirochaetales bacterium]